MILFGWSCVIFLRWLSLFLIIRLLLQLRQQTSSSMIFGPISACLVALFLTRTLIFSVPFGILYGLYWVSNFVFPPPFTHKLMDKLKWAIILWFTPFAVIFLKTNSGTHICISSNTITIGPRIPPLVSHPSKFVMGFSPLHPQSCLLLLLLQALHINNRNNSQPNILFTIYLSAILR